MEVFTNSKFDFVSRRRIFAIISLLMVAAAVATILINGFKLGVEFTGGTQITAAFDEDVSIEQIREVLKKNGYDANPSTLGGDQARSMFLIRVQQYYSGDKELGPDMKAALVAAFGEDNVRYWEFDPELGDRAQARIEGPNVSAETVRAALEQSEALQARGVEFENVEIDRAGTITIQLPSLARKVVAALKSEYKANDEAFSIEAIGPGVAEDLRLKGFLAIFVACLLILGYVWFRFDLDFAPGAVVALIHDATITAGVFALFGNLLGMELNVSTVAALLAIIGYSVNDTVVVYDRIRENIELSGKDNLHELVNRSINETLSRTLLTSVTTLFTTVSIMIFGGPVLRDFGIALTIGIGVGTYSSIFVASTLMLAIHDWRHGRKGAHATAHA